MSQLLSALKTIRRTADADAVDVPQESSPTRSASVAGTRAPRTQAPEGGRGGGRGGGVGVRGARPGA